MNTLKIISILLFAVICLSISLMITFRILKSKSNDEKYNISKLINSSSIFLAVSIVLNLVFKKISYLYDIIDQYSFDFHKVVSIGHFNYGFSPEMVKVSSIYLMLAFVWVVIASLFAKTISGRFFNKDTFNFEIFQAVILLSFAIALYPVFDFILDSFYIVLEKPVIN